MTLLFRTERFKKDFRRLPTDIQDRLPGILERLVVNRHHPGLRVKKMEGVRDILELRVTDDYRVTFQMIERDILLRRIGTHDVLRHP